VRVHAALLFPLLALLIVLAPVLVPWLYGERWAPAAPAAQLLAVAGFAAVVGTGTGPLLLAAGKPAAGMRYNAASLGAFVLVMLAAAPHGLLVTCAAVAVFRLVNLVATQYLLVQRIVGIPLVETLVKDVWPALAGCAALAVVAVPARFALAALGAPRAATLALTAALGLVLYALALRRLFPGTWVDLRSLLGRLGAGLPRPATRARARRATRAGAR
jgi:O-antigen/teichoic acid export membrane protein